jgi:hypothetical protein
VTSPGHPLTRLHRALERGTANQIRAIVAELRRPPGLEDALGVCLALLEREPETYPRAAAKWASRFAIERPLTLPLHRRITYCTCRTRDVIAHWAKRGRPRATDDRGLRPSFAGSAVGLPIIGGVRRVTNAAPHRKRNPKAASDGR